MNNTLTVSVLEQERGKTYRAILWYGVVTTHHDSVIFTAAFFHPNLFKNLKELKNSVLDWAGRNVPKKVLGIHDNTNCWPINPKIGFLEAAERTDLLVSPQGRSLGCCATRLPDQTLSTHLYTKGPYFPLENGGIKEGFPFGTVGDNLFLVAEKLFHQGEEVFDHLKLRSVVGIHDEGPCWPESF